MVKKEGKAHQEGGETLEKSFRERKKRIWRNFHRLGAFEATNE